MKKLLPSLGLLFLIILFAMAVNAQDKQVIPPHYKVNTKVDNMGYWQKCAAAGLVPVKAIYKPAPAINTGSRIFLKGVLLQDSPDVPVTTDNTTTQSENSIAADPNNAAKALNSNNSTNSVDRN